MAQPMGDHAATGFYYALLNCGGIQVVTILGQYALSWILGGTDFGYIGLAMMVCGFGGLIALAGAREVLIRRWREFDYWATPALWMCLTLGAISTALTMGAAPLAAWFFRDARLTPLIIVLSLQNVFNSFGVVAEARLIADLRFKRLAWISFTYSALVMVLSVIFALLGFGPYSFILPWPIGAVVRAALWWQAARLRISPRPQVRLWKHMLGDNALLLTGAVFMWITSQCDYLILGRIYPDKSVVGTYFWAFNLSTQALQLLAVNLGGVLLPSLAKLQDEPQRLLNAFLRAAKVLMVLALPACLLQATLADPLIRLAFPAKWYPAIPIVAILSAGWVLLVLQVPAINLLKAQGRFAALMWYLALCAGIFLAAVYVGARWRAGVGAAVGDAVYSAIVGPLSVALAIRPLGGRGRDVLGVFLPSILAGVVAFGLAALLQRAVPAHPVGHLLRVIVIVAVGCPAYALLVRLIAPTATIEILERIQSLLKRGRPHAAAT
jgi:O-antigen/teichoic acid export membrane protein